MLNKKTLLLAAAVVALGASAASAQDSNSRGYGDSRNTPAPTASDRDTRGDYGNGYNYGYDDGVARRDRDDRYRAEAYRRHDGYQRGAYYYGADCDRDNGNTGLIIGAIAGGVIGNQFGHGDGRTAATVGGVILGGMAGSALSRHTDCGDRRYALSSYSAGFEGRIGQRYSWRAENNGNYGSFTPTREYSRDGNTCRDFRETTYQNGRTYNDTGTACLQRDGNWHVE